MTKDAILSLSLRADSGYRSEEKNVRISSKTWGVIQSLIHVGASPCLDTACEGCITGHGACMYDAEALREENRVLKNALNFCERAAVHHAKTLPASDIVGMIAHHPTIQDITRGYGETPPDADPVAALREEIAKLKDSLRYTIGQVISWQEYATGCEQEDTEEMKIAKELTK